MTAPATRIEHRPHVSAAMPFTVYVDGRLAGWLTTEELQAFQRSGDDALSAALEGARR